MKGNQAAAVAAKNTATNAVAEAAKADTGGIAAVVITTQDTTIIIATAGTGITTVMAGTNTTIAIATASTGFGAVLSAAQSALPDWKSICGNYRPKRKLSRSRSHI